MKRIATTLGAVVLLAGGVAVAAMAGGHNGGPPPTITTGTTGGHTPITICHKPGTPAQQTLIVDDDSVQLTGHLGHGDTIGACEELPPIDYCDTLEGVQAEDEDCPPPPVECDEGEVLVDGQCVTPPVDVCENLPGVQTEGPCDEEPPVVPPVVPPGPTHDCVFVGADKDGGTDAYGGTNDDCAPFPDPAKPADPVTPATVTVQSTTSGPATVVTVTKPPVSVKAKPKKKATPKPDKPVKIVHVSKAKKGLVVITTSDGKKHVGVMGSG